MERAPELVLLIEHLYRAFGTVDSESGPRRRTAIWDNWRNGMAVVAEG
jgi:hypothetical protein